MKRFAALFEQLDRSTATLDKRAALVAYFRSAPPRDAAWALWLLSGRKIGGARAKLAGHLELRTWAGEESATPAWLVDECYSHVGDLAETLALLLEPDGDEAPGHEPVETEDQPDSEPSPGGSLADWIEQRLLPVANTSEPERRAVVVQAWRTLPFLDRLVFNKLLTGSLRVGVSQALVQQAIATVADLPVSIVAQRLLGPWEPGPPAWMRLLEPAGEADAGPGIVPFFLASPLEQEPESLGPIEDWLLEWKWDGIRVQLVHRASQAALWSRGEERLDGRFPEIEQAALRLPTGCVIDGELLAWRDPLGAPEPFAALQTRIQRLRPGPKTLSATPVRLLAYDLLFDAGEDLREQPLQQRRERLEALLHAHADPRIALSPQVQPDSWEQAASWRDTARERGVEGLMLKRRSSPYRQGRRRGDWWKWKIDPLNIDAVLLYAQAGHGRRSTLYTDYTFGVWDGDALVPVAKAYSGLSDAQILELDRWIRAHTIERFGPVRSVRAAQVFELGFEAVNRSARHKSGIAVRFPRILRWRRDKKPQEADRIESLRALAR